MYHSGGVTYNSAMRLDILTIRPWETWRAWLHEYRELVRDVQDRYEEHHGRRHND